MAELLVVLVVVGTVGALAVPSFTGMLRSMRGATLASTFLSDLHLTRNEAIKRNARAVLCKSPDGMTCSTNGGWQAGWIVFQDSNNNGLFDADEPLIRRQGPGQASLRLTGNSQVANYVSYSALGSPKLISGAFQSGTFTLCSGQGVTADARRIVLSATGNPRSQKGTAGDCL